MRAPRTEFIELWEDINKNLEEETEEMESLPSSNAGGLNVFSQKSQPKPFGLKEQEAEDVNVKDYASVCKRING